MKRNLILIFCVLLGLSWFTAISEAVNNPKKVQEHLARAAELEAQGIYVDAITEYEEALSYWPNDAEISLKMAEAQLQIGNSKKFANICKSVAAGNQKDVSAMNRLMAYYTEKNDRASAVKYLSEFTEQHPKNENAMSWLVRLKGSYEELFLNYEEPGAIVHNSMVVAREGKYGLADGRGAELLETEYDEVHPYSEDGLALILKDGAYVYIDRDAQTRLVPDGSYGHLGMMSSGRTMAEVSGKYALLDDQLQPLTEFMWDDLTQISDSTGACAVNGKWALINKNGKTRTEYVYEDVIRDEYGFCAGQKRIFVKENGKYHLVDKKGSAIGDLTFDDAHIFPKEGFAAVCEGGKWGFIDARGKLVIEYQYEDAQSFSNGFAAVCVGGKWGYIDENNHQVVEPKFDSVTPISEVGTASVKQEEWMLIQLELFR